jgi:hypothetical protein
MFYRLSLFGLSLSSVRTTKTKRILSVAISPGKELKSVCHGSKAQPLKRFFFAERSVRHLRAQHAARESAGVLLVLIQDFSIDDRVFDALCRNDQTPATAGQVTAHLGAFGR